MCRLRHPLAVAAPIAAVRMGIVNGRPVGMALTFHMTVRWSRDNRSLYPVRLGGVNRRGGRPELGAPGATAPGCDGS